jgi:hypothetical protein
MQSRPAPVLVDEFEVGLDRSNINKNQEIQLPVSQAKSTDITDDHNETDIDRSSAHHMVDSIKHHKHRAGMKIRKTLHIGKASDDMSHETTILANNPDEKSESRLVHDTPKPDKVTVKDLIHNPIDTISSKISGQGNQQIASNVAAKEIPHGDEVDLIRASEAAQNAVSDAARLLAIQDLSKLMEERQATYVRWTFDRHITKVRELPRDTMVRKPRTAFERYNPQEGVVIDWKAYGRHVNLKPTQNSRICVLRVTATHILCASVWRPIHWLRIQPTGTVERDHHAKCRAFPRSLLTNSRADHDNSKSLSLGKPC